jgi:hypothetical protein
MQSYLAEHPMESAACLLREELANELDRREAAEGPVQAHRLPTAVEIEVHAQLWERLARLHRERDGIRGRIRCWLGIPDAG